MADVEFQNYLRLVMRGFLRRRAEEIGRVKFANQLYLINDSAPRPQKDIDTFFHHLEAEIDLLVEQYIRVMEQSGLISAEAIMNNPQKVDDVMDAMEQGLMEKLRA